MLVFDSETKLSEHMDELRKGEPSPEPAAHFKTFVEADVFVEAVREVK